MATASNPKQNGPGGMPPEVSVWVPQLIETLRSQSRLLGELRDLAETQAEAFGEGDAKTILDVLADRRTLLAKTTAAEDTAAPLLTRWRRLLELEATGIESEEVEIATLLGQVESLRDEILALDSHGQEVLDERRGQVAESLAGMRRGKRAVNAYGPTPEQAPRYQDREG